MEFVEWSEAYSVGDVLMDAHHRIFFQMVREFSKAPEQGSRDAMKQRIAFLAEYAAMHLAAEEGFGVKLTAHQLDVQLHEGAQLAHLGRGTGEKITVGLRYR